MSSGREVVKVSFSWGKEEQFSMCIEVSLVDVITTTTTTPI